MFRLVSQRRFNELQEKYDKIQDKIIECEKIQTKNKELETEIYSLKSQLVEIKKQIREQTEADLFFISAKVQKKLLDGEPKENIQDLYSQQTMFQNMLAQQQQQFYNPSFLDGLGLGGLLKGRF